MLNTGGTPGSSGPPVPAIDAYTFAFSHELVELLTNPGLFALAGPDQPGPVKWGVHGDGNTSQEIADVCTSGCERWGATNALVTQYWSQYFNKCIAGSQFHF
jgi:hypothetical protein